MLLLTTTSGTGSSSIFIIVIILILLFIIAVPYFVIKLLGKTVKECIHEAKKPYNPDNQNRF
jgi:flagellar basal body-associated protein FliL